MRLATLATSCALLAACFSKPGFTPSGDGGIDASLDASIDAPTDGPPIDPAGPALIATGGGSGGTGGHACRITAGKLYCWGSNSNGQVARDGVADYSGTPGTVKPTATTMTDSWTSVATGALHTCGVHSGEVYCWGQSFFRQVAPALGSNSMLSTTRVVLPGTDAVDRVFAGGFATCAIKASGDAYCWGDINLNRMLGPSTVTRLGPAGTLFTQIAIADDHACAIATDGVVHCWGEAEEQQTGQGDEEVLTLAQAKPLVSTDRFTSLSAGHEATCGTTTDGKLICWGSSNQGQLGETSPSSNGHAPLQIGTDTGWTNVAVGARHTCGVRAGDVYCFGYDQYGALGDGTFHSRLTLPSMKVDTAMTVSQIAASDGYTCALSSDGVTMKCWGSNAKGELGNKEASRKLDPVAVAFPPPLQPAQQIVTGNNHSCALIGMALPAPAYCWGLNSERQIGSTSDQVLHAEPVPVGGYTFTQIAAGGLHTCGITSDDSVIACWGDNVSHQLGPTNNASMDTVTALPSGSGAKWTSVAAGSRMSCGITDANRLYCWGMRAGQTIESETPVEYVAPTGIWKAISIGSDFAVGVIESAAQPRMYSFSLMDPEKLCAANLPSDQTFSATPTEILSGMIPQSVSFPTVAAAQHSGEHTCMLRYSSSPAPAPPIMTCFGTATNGRTAGVTTCGTMPNTVNVTSPLSGVNWAAPTGLNQTLFTASDHSCALAMNGQLICWGMNGNSELGRMFPGVTPLVIGSKTWASIDGGFDHTCGIDGTRKVYCWGENQYGQVGDGSSYEPSPVLSGVP